jgi:hypothetical protein
VLAESARLVSVAVLVERDLQVLEAEKDTWDLPVIEVVKDYLDQLVLRVVLDL